MIPPMRAQAASATQRFAGAREGDSAEHRARATRLRTGPLILIDPSELGSTVISPYGANVMDTERQLEVRLLGTRAGTLRRGARRFRHFARSRRRS